MPVKTSNVKVIDDRVSFRLRPDLAQRFNRILQVSKRTKTSLVEESLEEKLPQFEKQYRSALAA